MATRRLQLVLDLDTGAYSGRLSAAGAQLKAFSGNVDRANRTMNSMGRSFDSLGSAMSTPLTKLRDYVLILGNIHFALLNLQTIAIGWVGSLLKQSMEVERLTMLMKGLSTATNEVGRNKEAKNNLASLYDLSRKTGFEVKALADAFVKMKSGGIDPTNGSLKSLANAVAQFGGTSETFHRASIAIQQMSGKGVVSMEELRQQLGEAIPTAIKDMARAMGKSLPELIDEISKGKVRAGPALAKMFQEFDRMYAGAGARMAQTLNGQLNAFKTNVTEMATVFTGLDTGGGLFEGARKTLEELNKSMRTSEARAAVAEFGQVVNDVFISFVNGVKWVIEWRNEIGAALKTIVAGFVAIKAAGMVAWFVQLGSSAAQSLMNIGKAAAISEGPLGRLSLATNALNRQQQLRAVTVEREIANATRASTAANQRIASITSEIAALRQQKIAIDAAAASAVNQARATFAVSQAATTNGRVISAVTGTYINQNQAIAQNRNAHELASRMKRRAEAMARLLAMREAALTAAVTAGTAATARSTAAVGAKTFALRAMTTATTLAAGAVRLLGAAVNLALGPIGLIATALFFAADAAGVFEDKADAAAAAAARLAQGIAALEDVKRVQDQNDALRKKRQALIDSDGETPDVGGGLVAAGGAKAALWLMGVRKNNAAEIAKIDRQIAKNQASLNIGVPALARDRGRSVAQFGLNKADTMDAAASDMYRQREQELARKYGADSQQYRDGIKKAQADRDAGGGAAYREAYRASLQKSFANAKNDVERAAIGAALEEFDSKAGSAAQSANSLAGGMDNLGKKTGGAAGKMSDAEKAAKKAADEYERAREKYANMFANGSAEIAEMEAEIAGLQGEMEGVNPTLAKFEEKLKRGLYADATTDEVEKLREMFLKLDKTTRELDYTRGLKNLRDELEASRLEADRLWKSLEGGTWEADQRRAQVEARFADQLKEARRLDALDRAELEKQGENGGDIVAAGAGMGEREKAVRADIDRITLEQMRSDAAEVTREWELMAEEMEAGLISREEVARVRHEREIADAWQRIQMAKLEGSEKQRAEDAYYRWKKQKEIELARDSESATMKMVRSWAEVGQGIQDLMAQSINTLVEGLMDAEFNIGKFVVSIIKALVAMIIKALIAYAILSALGMANNAGGQPVSFGSFLKGQIGAGLGGKADPSSQIGFGSSNGIVDDGSGRLVQTAPLTWGVSGNGDPMKFHSGGWLGGRKLKANEVPFVGLKDELILTKEQQGEIASAMGSRGVPNVTMNIINNSGQDVTAEASQPRFDGKAYVIDVVMEALSKPGPLRDQVAANKRP